MKIAIVEDERLASGYLKSILERQEILTITDITILQSVKEAITFFKAHAVDLVFMDIHLGDGKSLDIFEAISITSPIIFVTAYDSYAIQVFKHFTIDYLLKPFEEEELLEALTKYKKIKSAFNINQTVQSLATIDDKGINNYQRRFLVNHGYRFISINDSDISSFMGSGKHLFIFTENGNSFLYDDTIKDIITKLDPEFFFKVNRKYILHRSAIKEVIRHSSQKVEIVIDSTIKESAPIFVSKSEINTFKKWLDQ
ncbi:LytR/AlgR family response regulator transcription factor [Flavobacterium cerinum]|uniref:LytTR family DNA-binding domain-containing protein n=1 Tax=Flavobacterium cerinum TaxID=2502784 RepID=A0ABY5IW20_9FLAO|nr:LytTR family DNA-binding domain-containing protein [Flavobacterium cerinum]UUC46859.1 LytTR family DNA-binding domain-containing protein [Flavobacterium cerinum]